MAFEATNAQKLAQRAGRGDLRATRQLLKDIIEHIDDLSPTELGYIDGVTPGTVTANKALVAGASGELDALSVTRLKHSIDTTATSSVTIANHGHTVLPSSSARNYLLAAPAAGLIKRISRGPTGTTETITITLANSSVVKFRLSSGDAGTVLTSIASNDFFELEGLSDTVWRVNIAKAGNTSSPPATS